MAVTLTQLHAFLTVVRRGSVTAAAEELVVTQPSVSAAVSALERELGVRLTERAGRTVRPTAAGEAYAPYAADVLGLLEQGARTWRSRSTWGTARWCSSGCSTTRSTWL
jgi:DNA-binding transcriptional LysR family regulator